MKIILAGLTIVAGILILVISRQTDTPVPEAESSGFQRAIAAKEQIAPVRTDAGFAFYESVDTSDSEATQALLEEIAGGNKQFLEMMQQENAFVTRRQVVELDESFPSIAARIASGEKIESLQIPDFDGESIKMDLAEDQIRSFGGKDGYLSGGVPEKELSDVIVSYYEDESYGYINLPSDDRVIEYQPYGDKKIVLAEIDSRARNIAQPCAHCEQEGSLSNHIHHPAENGVLSH